MKLNTTYFIAAVPRSPLTQGRELKPVKYIIFDEFITSPLTQGRELKHTIEKQIVDFIDVAPHAGA